MLELHPSALFIDFDGTLSSGRFWSSSDTASTLATELLFAPSHTLIAEWMRGKRRAEEINDWLSSHGGLDPQPLWQLFVDGCRSFEVSPTHLSLVKRIRECGVPVVLVTDNMDCFSRFTAPALGLPSIFSHIVNSVDHGCLKEEGLFLIAERLSGVPLTRTLLLDNSVPTCCLFNELGGTSYCVSGVTDTVVILDKLCCSLTSSTRGVLSFEEE